MYLKDKVNQPIKGQICIDHINMNLCFIMDFDSNSLPYLKGLSFIMDFDSHSLPYFKGLSFIMDFDSHSLPYFKGLCFIMDFLSHSLSHFKDSKYWNYFVNSCNLI